jgi:taurine dioxygenase
MQVKALDSCLGAEVSGITLSDKLDSSTLQNLKDALFKHQVLFFRNQPLSDDEHINFAANFGKPNLYPVVEMLGGTQTIEIVEDGPKRKPTAGNWHTDVTWLQQPPKIGSIGAQVMPEKGGDTLWCSLYSVYNALSADTKQRIKDLQIAHAPGPGFEKLVLQPIGDDFVAKFRERYGSGSQHALVRDHYVTGRPLIYLAGGFMSHVIGWDKDASKALLSELMQIAEDEAHHIRWQWQVDDIALWDERSTMHHVDTSHWPQPRRMRRCTVG